MRITAITPSVRPEGLPIVAKCLKRQDFDDFEWLIVAPVHLFEEISKELDGYSYSLVAEPPKEEGDYYGLNKAWNAAYQTATGELIVNIVDLIWFPPTTLSHLWAHFLQNPKACVTAIGHQYSKLDNGKPEIMVWKDPRARSDQGTFYEVSPADMEMCLASLPRQAILDCGGLDEVYDKGAAVGEKEMCWRLDKLGYKFFIDQTLEYRALQHPRLSEDWDEKYKISSNLFIDHMQEIAAGTRTLNVGCVK